MKLNWGWSPLHVSNHWLARTALAMIASLLAVGGARAQAPPTIITFPWDWHISVAPNVGTPTNPVPGETPVPIWLWGTATMQFGAPVLQDNSPPAPPTFDLGPGGDGPGTLTPEPPPLGGIYEIPIEILSMDLNTMGMPAPFPGGEMEVRLRKSPSQPSQGRITNLQNLGDGTIAMDSFFDIVYTIELTDVATGQVMNLDSGGTTSGEPEATRLGMSFGLTPNPDNNMVGDPLPELDVLWGPTWFWQTFPPGTAPPWVDSSFHPWDWPVTIHGHVTPEPASGMLSLLGVGLACGVMRRRRSAR